MHPIVSRLLAAPILLCLLALSAYGATVPTLNGRVNDNASLLKQAERDQLEGTLRALEDKTGVQIAILTVLGMDGLDIKSFSHEVAVSWKLGQKGKDNGLLLMYAVKEDKYRIEVGYGLEGAIPDGVAGDAIRLMRTKANPKKGTHDFGAAFTEGVSKLSALIEAEYAKDPSGESMRKHSSDGQGYLLAGLVVLSIVGIVGALTHILVGGTLGGVAGGVSGLMMTTGALPVGAMMLTGFILGLIATLIVQGMGSGGGGGYGYSGNSSSDSGGGFSGGGGDFGGGGADG